MAEPAAPPAHGRSGRRPRWWLIILAAAALIAAGLVGWAGLGASDQSSDYEVSIPLAPSASVEPGGAALALQQLQQAIESDDRAAAQALAAPTAGARELLGSLVTNADAARIDGLDLRYVDELGAIDADGTWSAAVEVAWRYAGFDRAPARTETVVRFVADGDEVRIAGIGGDALRTPVWMTGPLAVARTDDTLVLAADAGSLEHYVRLAERSVATVSRVLTAWDPQLVVEVPPDGEALERALDAEPGYYAQIAAVTGSADGSISANAPFHVYVNPDVFAGLGAEGQRVVLAHETAHVAGDGPISRAPTWLVEGFADYVALRNTSLPLTTTAAQIRDQVRADGPPTALPDGGDFDTRGTHLGAVYESAWLACQVLAERGGDAAFLGLYDEVSAGAPLGEQLSRRFGWTEADLVQAWQDRLVTLP